jgi:succinate dehydrogenase / fumarate reductase cytochrome b subunit
MVSLGFLFKSSLGRKYVMGVTGLLLFAFVIVHMLGNLQIFLGPDVINEYAASLKGFTVLLWAIRLGLLLIVVLHITSAIQLAIENRRARSRGYDTGKPVASSYAARTILLTGLIIFAFIIFHLGHFTVGFVDPQLLELRDAFGRHDVYTMMIRGFSSPIVSALYIVATGLLCLHLSHGVSSSFQSLGLRSNGSLRFFQRLAAASAALIFIGNSSIPIAILAGLGK